MVNRAEAERLDTDYKLGGGGIGQKVELFWIRGCGGDFQDKNMLSWVALGVA